jgi:hypothetical protein
VIPASQTTIRSASPPAASGTASKLPDDERAAAVGLGDHNLKVLAALHAVVAGPRHRKILLEAIFTELALAI